MTSRPTEHARDDRRAPREVDSLTCAIAVSTGGRPAEQMLAAMWPYLVGTAKGDQIRAAAEAVGVFGWIDGSATEERPARLGGNQWTGKKHSDETKEKMAAARRAYWARRREADDT